MRTPLLAILLLNTTASAADPPAEKPDPAKADQKARVEKYLDAGLPGVFVSDDKDVTDGKVGRAYVVGVATISSVLGVDEGLEIAREKAEESAKAEFVKWLGSSVTVRKTTKNEILLTKEGDGTTVAESGKAVERRTKEFEETAAGVVRGLRVVGAVQSGKDKKYVLVYRWEPAAVVGGKESSGPTTRDGDKKVAPKIPDKKVIIDD